MFLYPNLKSKQSNPGIVGGLGVQLLPLEKSQFGALGAIAERFATGIQLQPTTTNKLNMVIYST